MALLLYYRPFCPFCKKILDHLNKIGKKIPLKNVSESKDIEKDLQEVGGKVQVPCLVYDSEVLYESDSIIEWLDENKDKI